MMIPIVTRKKRTIMTTASGSPCPAFVPTGPKKKRYVWATAPGRVARMPIVIRSETPLPMPRCVICSPSHIMSIVPAVR